MQQAHGNYIKHAQEMDEDLKLNDHNKQEHPPMHTCEHIVNRTMDAMFGCGRAVSAHIERKKSKLDFAMPQSLDAKQIEAMEKAVNDIIDRHLDVTATYMPLSDAAMKFDLGRLPKDVSSTVRVVRVGDYDECLCLGNHVSNTSEIGHFKVTTWNYADGLLRIRFKLV